MDLAQTVATLKPPQQLLLNAVDWDTYEMFLAAMGKRPHRLTYDGHSLEVSASSYLQEVLKLRLGFVLVFVAAAFDVELRGSGSTTLKRKAVRRGIDPDKGFFLGEHSQHMARRDDLDLDRDPPPDIAIELDIYPSELNRPAVFAALKVPELWVVKPDAIQILRLQADGEYAAVARSEFFPKLRPQAFLEFVLATSHEPDSALIPLAQEWARKLAAE